MFLEAQEVRSALWCPPRPSWICPAWGGASGWCNPKHEDIPFQVRPEGWHPLCTLPYKYCHHYCGRDGSHEALSTWAGCYSFHGCPWLWQWLCCLPYQDGKWGNKHRPLRRHPDKQCPPSMSRGPHWVWEWGRGPMEGSVGTQASQNP